MAVAEPETVQISTRGENMERASSVTEDAPETKPASIEVMTHQGLMKVTPGSFGNIIEYRGRYPDEHSMKTIREALPNYFDRLPSTALTPNDVRSERLDKDAFGRVHQEIRFAVLLQVMTSIRDEQPGANSVVKALAAAAIEVIG
jgi:hypothetical protein